MSRIFFSVVAVILAGLVFYLGYLIIRPFLIPIIWAFVIGATLYPIYEYIVRLLKGRKMLASFIMLLLVVCGLAIPILIIAASLANEVISAYRYLEQKLLTGQFRTPYDIPLLNNILAFVNKYFEIPSFDFKKAILENVRIISSFLVSKSSQIVINFSSFLLNFGLILFTLFFVFKDGYRLLDKLKSLIPMPDSYRDNVIGQLHKTLVATIYGGVVTALIQGILGGIGFAIAGLPSVVLWGVMMAFFSLIPMVGAGVIWVPATIILLVQQAWIKAIFLGLWGALVVSLSDNFLRPYFVGERVDISPVILMFAILGGIQAFGIIGIIIGPLVVSVVIAIINIYELEIDGIVKDKNCKDT